MKLHISRLEKLRSHQGDGEGQHEDNNVGFSVKTFHL